MQIWCLAQALGRDESLSCDDDAGALDAGTDVVGRRDAVVGDDLVRARGCVDVLHCEMHLVQHDDDLVG